MLPLVATPALLTSAHIADVNIKILGMHATKYIKEPRVHALLLIWTLGVFIPCLHC